MGIPPALTGAQSSDAASCSTRASGTIATCGTTALPRALRRSIQQGTPSAAPRNLGEPLGGPLVRSATPRLNETSVSPRCQEIASEKCPCIR